MTGFLLWALLVVMYGDILARWCGGVVVHVCMCAWGYHCDDTSCGENFPKLSNFVLELTLMVLPPYVPVKIGTVLGSV